VIVDPSFKWLLRWIDARPAALLLAGRCVVDFNVQLTILGSDRPRRGVKMREDGKRRGAGKQTGEGMRKIEGMRRSRGADLNSAAAVKNKDRRKNIVVRRLSASRRRQQESEPWQSAKGRKTWRRRATVIDGLIVKR
jgi:hypothetical protein